MVRRAPEIRPLRGLSLDGALGVPPIGARLRRARAADAARTIVGAWVEWAGRAPKKPRPEGRGRFSVKQ